jgi:hypothetical protein
MKSGAQKSKNTLSAKNAKNFYINYHLATQLYYIYKIESLPKKEPRLPVKDWRRPVIKHNHKFTPKTATHFLNTEILALKKAFEWFSSPIQLYLHKLSR